MKSSKNKGFTKPMLYVAAAICLGLVLFFVFWAPKTQHLPPNILGEWYSDDPRYQTCFVTINADSFIIGGADGNIYPYRIKSITAEDTADSKDRLYTLLCEDPEGLELAFRLYYDAERGMLSYKNQRNIIWLKAKKN
jgi:hypothetical protein